MKKRILYLIFPIITLILEILPFGAVCNFANPEGESIRNTYSYFDLTPYGYSNFAPFLTAIVTCTILILLVIHLFSSKDKMIIATKILLCVAIALSLCPLLLGTNYFSVIGGLITLSLIIESGIVFFIKEK